MNAHNNFGEDHRTRTLAVAVDAAESRAINEAANIRGLSVSDFLRETAMREAAFPYVHYTSNGLPI